MFGLQVRKRVSYSLTTQESRLRECVSALGRTFYQMIKTKIADKTETRAESMTLCADVKAVQLLTALPWEQKFVLEVKFLHEHGEGH